MPHIFAQQQNFSSYSLLRAEQAPQTPLPQLLQLLKKQCSHELYSYLQHTQNHLV